MALSRSKTAAADMRAARRLAVVLAADVVGYSRLMGEDEEDTLHRLAEYRGVLEAAITGRGGRIVASAGDGFLAELPSAGEAVGAAAEVQQTLAERNRALPEERRMLFRIGINLGDVFAEGGDLLGDAVNVAARLEALADPGGICVGRPVRDLLRGKVPFEFEFLGLQRVKNIARPVKAYRVLPNVDAAWAAAPRRSPVPVRLIASAAAVVLLLVVAALGLGAYLHRSDEPAAKASTAAPATRSTEPGEPLRSGSHVTAGQRPRPAAPSATTQPGPASAGSSSPPSDTLGPRDEKKFGP